MIAVIAIVMGIAGSAFVTHPQQTDEYVKDAGQWVLKSTVDQVTGECITANPGMHCTFILIDQEKQPPYVDDDFEPIDDQAVWQRYLY